MQVSKIYLFVLLSIFMLLCSCGGKETEVREADELFHAGPPESGFGATFFGLYKNNHYKFCEGDFMDPGCYTGDYTISSDTITLLQLKKHKGLLSNRFLIFRYKEHDRANGAEGKVLPLSQEGDVIDDGKNYFLIRLDSLKNNR